jgi:hypothetical protein
MRGPARPSAGKKLSRQAQGRGELQRRYDPSAAAGGSVSAAMIKQTGIEAIFPDTTQSNVFVNATLWPDGIEHFETNDEATFQLDNASQFGIQVLRTGIYVAHGSIKSSSDFVRVWTYAYNSFPASQYGELQSGLIPNPVYGEPGTYGGVQCHDVFQFTGETETLDFPWTIVLMAETGPDGYETNENNDHSIVVYRLGSWGLYLEGFD